MRQTMQNINSKNAFMVRNRPSSSDDDDEALPSYQTSQIITNTENFDLSVDSPFGLDFSAIPDFNNILELAPDYATKMDDATADGILRDILNKPDYCHNTSIQNSNVVDEQPFFPHATGGRAKTFEYKADDAVAMRYAPTIPTGSDTVAQIHRLSTSGKISKRTTAAETESHQFAAADDAVARRYAPLIPTVSDTCAQIHRPSTSGKISKRTTAAEAENHQFVTPAIVHKGVARSSVMAVHNGCIVPNKRKPARPRTNERSHNSTFTDLKRKLSYSENDKPQRRRIALQTVSCVSNDVAVTSKHTAFNTADRDVAGNTKTVKVKRASRLSRSNVKQLSQSAVITIPDTQVCSETETRHIAGIGLLSNIDSRSNVKQMSQADVITITDTQDCSETETRHIAGNPVISDIDDINGQELITNCVESTTQDPQNSSDEVLSAVAGIPGDTTTVDCVTSIPNIFTTTALVHASADACVPARGLAPDIVDECQNSEQLGQDAEIQFYALLGKIREDVENMGVKAGYLLKHIKGVCHGSKCKQDIVKEVVETYMNVMSKYIDRSVKTTEFIKANIHHFAEINETDP
ncbi:uncharacterized protein LOC134966108 [Pseudophryne corroboree]|uniref:uncharacterized protein LOC134966108 n=2 Tax=Pseudophryne corroboree TaxID=495146 RepID=UPI0030816734